MQRRETAAGAWAHRKPAQQFWAATGDKTVTQTACKGTALTSNPFVAPRGAVWWWHNHPTAFSAMVAPKTCLGRPGELARAAKAACWCAAECVSAGAVPSVQVDMAIQYGEDADVKIREEPEPDDMDDD